MHTDTLTVVMSADQAWAVLLGIVTPLLTSFVLQVHWSPETKRIVAIVISALIGVGTLLVEERLDFSQISVQMILNNVVLVIGAAQTTYALLWKPTGIADKVEQATSLRPPPPKHAAPD